MNLEEKVSKSQYKDILTVFNNFPIWLQQALFAGFKEQLYLDSADSILNDFDKNELFSLYVPNLTHTGEHERDTKANKLPLSVYKFLEDVTNGLNITEMAIKNNMPLNVLANIFINCLERELISLVRYEKILHLANFLAGKIIVGEFLCRIGKISRMDMNEALNYQTLIQTKRGQKVDTVNILVAKKCVSKDYVKSVIKYYIDSKRKIKDINTEVIACNSDLDIETLKSTNEKLQKENTIMRDQLRKILNLSPTINQGNE